MKKIKGVLSFLFTSVILLVTLFMIFGSITLFLEFGATNETLMFILFTVIISIPSFLYLNKKFKNLVGI